MMPWLAAAAWLLGMLAVGECCVRWLDPARLRRWPERAALGWGLGAAVTALLSQTGALCGLPLDRRLPLVLSAAAVVFLLCRLRPPSVAMAADARLPGRGDGSRIALLLLWAVGLFLLVAFTRALWEPETSWDGRTHWGLLSKSFFHGGSLSTPVLEDPHSPIEHHRYPVLMPLAQWSLYCFLGEPDDQVGRLPYPLFYAALLGLLWGFLRARYPSPWREAMLLYLAGIPFLIRNTDGSAFSGYSDVPLTFFTCGYLLCLVEWLEQGRTVSLRLAAPFAAAVLLAKQQGIPLFAILTVLAAVVGWAQRRRLAPLMLMVGGVALVCAPWFLHAARLPQDPISVTLVARRLQPGPIAENAWGNTRRAGHQVLLDSGQWSLFWWVFGTAALLRRSGHPPATARLLLMFIAAYGLVIAAVLLPAPIAQYSAHTVDRLLLPCALGAALYVAGCGPAPR